MKTHTTLLLLLLAAQIAVAEPARTVTAYCACEICCGKSATGITASGRRPVEGRTVAASRSIPLGTRIHIEGIGWRVVEDRTARRYDGRVDIFFASHKEALKFGKQERKVTIIKETK